MIHALVISTFVFIFAGWKLFENEKLGFPLKIALSFAAGTVFISLYMLLLGSIGINLSLFAIALPSLLIFIVSFRSFLIKLFTYLKEFKMLDDNIFLTLGNILLIVLVILLIISNLSLPVFRADAIGGWVFKAKIFFFDRAVNLNLFKDIIFCNTADYPLLSSLNMAFMTISAGYWNDGIARLFFCSQYLFGIIIYYGFLKGYIRKHFALIATIITFSIPTLLTNAEIGYVDFTLAFYVLLSSIFFKRFIENNSKKDLALSALFIGATAWTKNDGFALVAVLIFVLSLFMIKNKNAISSIVPFTIISASVSIPYKLMTMYFGLKSHMANSTGPFIDLSRLPTMLGQFSYEMFNNAYNWLYFWIILAILSIFSMKKIKQSGTFFPLLFILLSIAAYVAIYLMVPNKVFIFAEGTVNRLLLGLAPAASFIIISAAFDEHT